jgi:hypothetical protein
MKFRQSIYNVPSFCFDYSLKMSGKSIYEIFFGPSDEIIVIWGVSFKEK